jgi:hypothetical protein
MSKNLNADERMKAIIEFTLPEEQEQFEDATNGWKWSYAMWKLDQYLRAKVKYPSDNDKQETIDAFHEAREELHRILNQENLEFK